MLQSISSRMTAQQRIGITSSSIGAIAFRMHIGKSWTRPTRGGEPMATLNIEGRKVTVDDSFLKLSREEQQATVDEIASQFSAPPEPVSANNVVRSAATGVPIIGGLLNKADAATNAGLSYALNPLFDEKDQLTGTLGERYHKSLAIQEGSDAKF